MTFYFSKKHIPRMKMKLDGMMILKVRCIILTVNQIQVVFTCCSYCSFLSSIALTVRKKASDNHGRILILEALIDDNEFILINL